MNEPVRSNHTPLLPALRLLLLPGMDGTGELFSGFLKSLPEWIHPQVVHYPARKFFSYGALLPIVRDAMPPSEPFVLLAESFSTPIAVLLAADPPSNMQALVICAGFITSPIGGVLRWSLGKLAPLLFRLPHPAFAIRTLLLGRGAPPDLVQRARTAISSVSPQVLERRLRAVLACNETERIQRISLPVLYIRPTDDRLVSEAAFRSLCSTIPGLVVEKIPGPHLILQRQPRAAADAITAFLDRALNGPFTSS